MNFLTKLSLGSLESSVGTRWRYSDVFSSIECSIVLPDVVLVALYEQNDKPSSAVEFIQQKLGGPSLSEYEKLQAEIADLRIKYNELLATHQETCKKLDDLKNSCQKVSPARETIDLDGSNGLPSENFVRQPPTCSLLI
ncbi:hypothetical protein MLD38_020627 [Melastoma candidum]|uniref:Uncharacterized protein n=1 Tax=Melastoma candidum TaxID=119954 RepID=A0ACB9QLL6_9MYRT|nr:hypothetical protein MLD38_020627 [Melastoma candidum]